MTKDEALRVLERYEVYGCGVCLQDGREFYQTENGSAVMFVDAEEALKLAIDALKTEAIPIEWIEKEIEKSKGWAYGDWVDHLVHQWKQWGSRKQESKGCPTCKHQIEPLRACEWLENGGDGVVHLTCPRWEKKKKE